MELSSTGIRRIPSLETLFYPKSIAVVGASRQSGSVGYSFLAKVLSGSFQGVVYPVNPKARGIQGVRCYTRLRDIPDTIDLAVILVPNHLVPGQLNECAQIGIKNVIVISAGFKESGPEGSEFEKKAQDIVRRYNMTLIGPNCLGLINTDPVVSLNATFAAQMPRQGNLAFISQSGALGIAVLEYAREANIGISKFISMGNKAGVTENDLLRYLHKDPRTDVILMYLEDIVNGRLFMTVAREITSALDSPKPIIALKAGRTLIGARAASSHTGSLSGSDKAYDAIFEQSGVIRVSTLEELFDYAKGFSRQPLPKGRNVAILTNSGGPAILATDALIEQGLSVASLSEDTRIRLRAVLPPSVVIDNPVDLIAEADHHHYELSLKALFQDKDIHAGIVILTPTASTDVEKIAETIVQSSREHHKPVACCFLGVHDVSRGLRILEENGVPAYRFPESAAKVIAEMAKFTEWMARPRTEIKTFEVHTDKAKGILEGARKEGRTFLYEYEAYEALRAYGFPTVHHEVVRDEQTALDAARRIGFPVVLKVVSPDILHKFDFGGVQLNLRTDEDVRKGFQTVQELVRTKAPNARVRGFMIAKMATGGREVILGMNRDSQFGPLLMFGLGGIYVEALEDVSFRLAPIRELSALTMIRETKTHKILEGFRGGPVYDIDAIADCLKRLSQMVIDIPEIKELDLNPLIVLEKGRGCAVVDARIILEPSVLPPA